MKTLRLFTFCSILVLSPFAISAAQQEVVLIPSKDNTLYESTDTLSNGAGSYLFFGKTNQGAIRRALMMFDVAAEVPEGASIASAALQITVTKTISSSTPVAAHRVLKDWGEGTSDASANEGSGTAPTTGDATWFHTFYNTEMWDSPGGDYDSGTLTSAQSGTGGTVELPSTDDLVSAVQSWLDTPGENYGLILIGGENDSPTAKRIGSREGSEADRPQLTVTYSMPTATERNELPDFLTELTAFPNPAGENATIRYTLSTPRDVKIQVHDVTGRLVATPVSGTQAAGSHSIRLDAEAMTPGLYLVRLVSGGESALKTLVVR